MALFEITESCVSSIKSLVRADTEEQAREKFYSDGEFISTTREDIETQLEDITEVPEEEPTFSVQAAAYELICSCGGQLLNTQLTQLPRPEPEEEGVWVWVCPDCQFRHCFDGGEVQDAF